VQPGRAVRTSWEAAARAGLAQIVDVRSHQRLDEQGMHGLDLVADFV
jgi:hypothetical protein